MSTTPASDLLRADHRRIEQHLDRMLDALLHLSSARLPDLRDAFQAIRALAEPHFRKEEDVFYPRLRPRFPALLAHMDTQHEQTRELEAHLNELLENTGKAFQTVREQDEVHRFGIEFHDAVQVHIVDEEDHLLRIADSELSSAEQSGLLAEMKAAGR